VVGRGVFELFYSRREQNTTAGVPKTVAALDEVIKPLERSGERGEEKSSSPKDDFSRAFSERIRVAFLRDHLCVSFVWQFNHNARLSQFIQ
jgi:hypothetical protein